MSVTLRTVSIDGANCPARLLAPVLSLHSLTSISNFLFASALNSRFDCTCAKCCLRLLTASRIYFFRSFLRLPLLSVIITKHLKAPSTPSSTSSAILRRSVMYYVCMYICMYVCIRMCVCMYMCVFFYCMFHYW